ncbi:thermonuclease family protein [Sphingopyxis sp.]|jgi:micrococcal nuclease|uniref:thermonuclease family protein n=1 Tax=Sphingopyxis sp. TaxID=1908224 RepID=UPI003F6FD8C3
MAGPDFHYPRQRNLRRRSPMRPRRRVGSNLWLTPVMAIAFVAALATFQRFPDGVSIDWEPGAIAASFAGVKAAPTDDRLSANFGICHSGGGSSCVVDGDTFWFAGDKYRIADIDTPETHPARCAEEAALGAAATERLHEWLNAGAFSLESAGRDADQYDRKLRIVTRGGTSVGAVLVADGLARPWEGRRRPWC